MAQAPWWAWLGGVFGICFVMATVFALSEARRRPVSVALIVTTSTVDGAAPSIISA